MRVFGGSNLLLHAREVREVSHVHAIQVEDYVDRNRAWLQGLSAHDFVEIEGDALAVADGVDDHQRLAGAKLHDVAGSEEVCVAETAELVDLDGATLGLEFLWQPVKRSTLANGDDHIVDCKLLRLGFAINFDRRRVDRTLEFCRMQVQRFDLAIAEYRRYGAAVNQLDTFLQHVVQIFGEPPAFPGDCLRP